MLAAERVLGLAAHWLLGLREQWRQKPVAEPEGRSRTRVKTGRKKGRELLPALNVEKPAQDPCSCFQTEKQSLWPPLSSLLTAF